ncbi:MAG: SapC family protein [Alphaproteobacteria bacterium]
MAAQSSGSEPEITGQVLFYRQIEPLSYEKHGRLGAKQIERPFAFLGAQDVVPITANEFPVASACYPLIFAGPEKTPLAVMGIRSGENLFVSLEGDVDPEVYLPAFARRYPFVFATTDKSPEEELLVCIDPTAPMIGENTDTPFFTADKQLSPLTQNAIEFLKEFDRCGAATTIFVRTLQEMDLFEQKSTVISNLNEKGEKAHVTADYFGVSEDKLNALPADKFNQLREMNMVGPIYAHLVSLLMWPRLLHRAAMRDRAAQGLSTPLGQTPAVNLPRAAPATPKPPIAASVPPPREPTPPPKKKGLFG